MATVVPFPKPSVDGGRRALRFLVAVLLGVLLAVGMLPRPAAADTGWVYTTPGEHTVGGRQWRTWCEEYTSTIHRCQSEIWATQIIEHPGSGYEVVNGWAFNNLTYLPIPESAWGDNPLASTGDFTSNGRQWRTSCKDEWTGPNGCRSFIRATVVAASGGRYVKQDRWIFNNLVQFGRTTTPPDVTTPRSCTVTVEGIRIDLPASRATATAVRSSGTTAVVTMVQRVPNTSCTVRTVFRDTTGRIGARGTAPAAERRQDTLTTPTGDFTVNDAFGLDPDPGTALSWRDVGPNSYWVLDNDSPHYNQWREASAGGFDRSESEHLADYAGQYDLVGVIDYNRSPAVKGKGGAIFLHVHGSGATAGCVSITKANMRTWLQHATPGDVIAIR
ncbi:L,D-transpeptidase family protein [Tessaracoccus rhinocerotis]|uniref:L,D-transpeptidase family protein n=1 Tax=Tessaracoccus rhinocerotis TaxID=1689449 RepID=A0A553K1Z2_9ACTN|nr:L,D-transpeptidase family protein [Tessaracoccus rhinocerotis]TRY18722.1 L,D-transpeptidase family protein [Tessaracoccus rhinocerotis]